MMTKVYYIIILVAFLYLAKEQQRFMLGKFIEDDTQINKFRWQCLRVTFLLISIPVSPVAYLYITSDFPTPLLVIILFTLITGVCAGMIGSDYYCRKIIITLEEDRIRRHGAGTLPTHISYSDLGAIIVKSNGVLIVKKGFAARLELLLFSKAYRLSPDVIFIPSLIRDYDDIKRFLLLEKEKRKIRNR